MQYHALKYEETRDKARLAAKYRKALSGWIRAGDTAEVLKHTFHVAAWIAFGPGPAAENLSTFKDLTRLLTDMLEARGRVEPPPRLVLVLRHVQELLDDVVSNLRLGYVVTSDFQLEEGGSNWAAPAIAAVSSAVAAGARGPRGPVAAKARAKVKAAPPGTHGRTDMALVRHILGPGRELPAHYSMRWDGYIKRWLSYRTGPNQGHVKGSNANMSRFGTDKEAIEHAYRAIMREYALDSGSAATGTSSTSFNDIVQVD